MYITYIHRKREMKEDGQWYKPWKGSVGLSLSLSLSLSLWSPPYVIRFWLTAMVECNAHARWPWKLSVFLSQFCCDLLLTSSDSVNSDGGASTCEVAIQSLPLSVTCVCQSQPRRHFCLQYFHTAFFLYLTSIRAKFRRTSRRRRRRRRS